MGFSKSHASRMAIRYAPFQRQTVLKTMRAILPKRVRAILGFWKSIFFSKILLLRIGINGQGPSGTGWLLVTFRIPSAVTPKIEFSHWQKWLKKYCTNFISTSSICIAHPNLLVAVLIIHQNFLFRSAISMHFFVHILSFDVPFCQNRRLRRAT